MRHAELVATFLFLVCILGVTSGSNRRLGDRPDPDGEPHRRINATGVSVNPARSLGPALVGAGSNPGALVQLWPFLVAPLIGGGLAGLLFRPGAVLDAEAT